MKKRYAFIGLAAVIGLALCLTGAARHFDTINIATRIGQIWGRSSPGSC